MAKLPTFTAGTPITSIQLNDLAKAIEENITETQGFQSTARTVDQLVKIKTIADAQVIKANNLEVNKYKMIPVNFTTVFDAKPVVVATVAEELGDKIDVFLSVNVLSAERAEIHIKTNIAAKSIPINVIAIQIKQSA